ncbi:MAG: two-component system response regulator AtoC [Granulosicoccus sp.]|jgi:two-component system response regulator AtoC
MNSETTKPTVFIAEDDEMFAQIIAVFVERNNEFNVETFQTGEALLERIHENPDIVILDHNLNDLDSRMMNGIDVLQKINTEKPTIPVVVFSGQEQVDTAVGLISSGACDYINKHDPSAFELLDTTLQDILYVKAEKSEFAELNDDIQDAKKRLMVVAALVIGMVVVVNLL